jgi:drug/metabolite transporter (DMT)-like permease
VAIIWSFAVILFKKSGENVHPIALNLFKNTVAFPLFIITSLVVGQELVRNVPASEYLLLMLSGVIGIGLGDTIFFMSLNRIGAGLCAIVDCMYSPSVIVLSVIFLHEKITVMQIIGTTMIVSAILLTVEKGSARGVDRKKLIEGFILGIISQILMAITIIMVKPIINYSPVLWATEVRLVGGLGFLGAFFAFNPNRKRYLQSIIHIKSLPYTISGSLTGAYLAMIVWLAGMKYTTASTASMLNQTSTIFLFVLAAIFLKEKIDFRRSVAIAIALAGAFIVMFG